MTYWIWSRSVMPKKVAKTRPGTLLGDQLAQVALAKRGGVVEDLAHCPAGVLLHLAHVLGGERHADDCCADRGVPGRVGHENDQHRLQLREVVDETRRRS